MFYRSLISATALAGVLLAAFTAAHADDSKHPNLKGQWNTLSPRGSFDPDKPPGRGTLAPLTEEYKAVYEANVKDQLAGGHGTEPSYMCLPPGMPRAMIAYESMEVVVTPETTYILIDHIHDHRRIHTDGRPWPDDIEPSFRGHSIGKWIDEGNTGRFNVLEVETRHLRGPRALDPAGMPTHADNQSLIKERFFLDKSDPKLLHDEITLLDHAYTRPWTVLKTYRRDPSPHPFWQEYYCSGDQELIKIGKETYYRGGDDNLMPTRKDQPPPDLRYFKKKQ